MAKKKTQKKTQKKQRAPKEMLLKVVVDAGRVVAVAEIPASSQPDQLIVRPVLRPGMVEYDVVVPANLFKQRSAPAILSALRLEESRVVYRAD
jgi:hypothetical protein